MKLYELSQNYNQVLNMIEDSEDDSLLDTLESIQDEIEIKVENIAKLIKNIDGDIEVIKAEEKRLYERRRALECKKERLKQYTEEQLTLTGLDRVKTPTFTIALQNNPPSVWIEDADAIPKSFLIEKQPEIDRKALLAYLKDGNELSGVNLVQSRSLRIR